MATQTAQADSERRWEAYLNGKQANDSDKCPYNEPELIKAWSDGKFDARENRYK